MQWTCADLRDLEECEKSLRLGSKSFYAASKILPLKYSRLARALYAFCRASDDAIDLVDEKAEALEQLVHRLRLIYQGTPLQNPADRAFAVLVRNYDIPYVVPEALLEGFAWDVAGRRYATLGELEDYAARVAGTVGVMMTVLMDVTDPVALARATDMAVAMQLTNIARDIGEDALAGRIYLPTEWLEEYAIDADEFMRHPKFDARLASMTRRLLERAAVLYARGSTGVAMLPQKCRPAIDAAWRIYSAISDELEKNNFDSVTQRCFVSKKSKVKLLLVSLLSSPLPFGSVREYNSLPANEFLISAIVPKRSRRPRFGQRLSQAVELFLRQDQVDPWGEEQSLKSWHAGFSGRAI